MNDFKFVCAQPDDAYYTWQVHLWLESLKELNLCNKAIVLVYIPGFRLPNKKWKEIEALYPEAEFAYYRDSENEITKYLGIYIPVLRPWVLEKYWRDHPEMKDETVVYIDCDTYLTDKLKIDHLIEDDINYLSDTNSYINAKYFDSKLKDVLPAKLEDYKKIDVLGDLAKVIGISREIAEANNEHSGGAQYILKNIDADFWADVKKDCITIRSYLMAINKQYFESENKGFQSWCADMWAVLWNLWKRERTTRNAKELEFSWASDPIEKVYRLGIFHNAGITTDNMGGTPCFYKGKYHQGRDPFTDIEQLTLVHDDARSKKMGTWFYTDKLLKLKAKYNVNYS
jgi:hypothetical protein